MANYLKNENLIPSIIAAAYVFPLSITAYHVGEKPVNIVATDFAWLLMPILIFGLREISRIAFIWTLLLLSYFLLIGFFGFILQHHSMDPLYSAASFSLAFIHILIGAFIYRCYGPYFLLIIMKLSLTLLSVLIISDFLLGNFPAGCNEVTERWGGCFGYFSVFGFPNSSMNYLVLLFFLVIYIAHVNKGYLNQPLIIVFFLVALSMLSLSRSASLVAVILCVSYATAARPVLGFILSIVILISAYFLVLNPENFVNYPIVGGLATKLLNAAEVGDVSNGRWDIWRNAFILFLEKPLFGYQFEYFSNYSDYGTVHQQYLELLFKSGLVGFFLYYGFLLHGLVLAYGKINFLALQKRKKARIYLSFFVLACLLSMLVQPTLTYPVASNFIFMIIGYLIQSRISSEHETSSTKPILR